MKIKPTGYLVEYNKVDDRWDIILTFPGNKITAYYILDQYADLGIRLKVLIDVVMNGVEISNV